VCEWICRASQQAILWTEGCIGIDDWPTRTVGIPSGRVFFPNAKGFRLNSAYGLPIQGSSVDFAPKGIYSRVFGSRRFPNTHEKNKIRGCKIKEIIAVRAQNSEVLYLFPIFKHP
jgi:hypothetical protein